MRTARQVYATLAQLTMEAALESLNVPTPTEITRLERCSRDDKLSLQCKNGFVMDWIKTRILLKKLEAQLRYDTMPDGDERKKLGALIEECEECLAGWNGASQKDDHNSPARYHR